MAEIKSDGCFEALNINVLGTAARVGQRVGKSKLVVERLGEVQAGGLCCLLSLLSSSAFCWGRLSSFLRGLSFATSGSSACNVCKSRLQLLLRGLLSVLPYFDVTRAVDILWIDGNTEGLEACPDEFSGLFDDGTSFSILALVV